MSRYDWLLLVYPREFRERFADGMRAAFAEDYAAARARGVWAAVRFLAATLLHTLWFGTAERLPRATTIRTFLTVDLRDAVRSLRTTPVITTVCVLSLALGIGANAALFSILNSLVLRPLPVHAPERLAVLPSDWTNPIWEQVRDRQSELFESAFAWAPERFNLSSHGRADPVGGAYVSGGMFATLGIGVSAGRPLLPSDDVRGGAADGQVVVISHRFWQQRFGGSQDALGRQLTVSGIPFRIVGVAPARFLGPEVGRAMDLFLPIASEAAIRGRESALQNRSSWWLTIMVRLKPDQTTAAAAAALNAARPAIREATAPLDWNAEYRAGFLKDDFTLLDGATGVSVLRNRFEQPLTIIMAVVGAVLLIACANIANLMLARTAARRHEMSLRLALGASRARLACQLLAESLLLAFAGGAAGLALAEAGAGLLIRQLGSEVSSVTLDLAVDWRVAAFAAGVSLLATILFGLAPAIGLGSLDPNEALKEQGRSVTGDRGARTRSVLVVAQVALSFVLIFGAGLFVRTFSALMTTPLGFDPEGLLIVGVDSRRSQIAPADRLTFAQRVAEEAAAAPGVARASLSFLTPMSGAGWNNRVVVDDGSTLARAEQVTWLNAVAPGWFETLGMRLVAGREFTATDVDGSEPVAVVNEAFVRRFVGPQNPIGRGVTGNGLGVLKRCVIVGVVNDAVYRNIRAGAVPTLYLPIAQAGAQGSGFAVTVRLRSDRGSVERSLAEALNRTDANLMFSFRDYQDQVRATIVQERLVAMLGGFFGGLAMLLAALGLYGVTSYSVSRRRAELAVRIALGASPGALVRMVLRRVALLLACGAVIGLGLSLWAAKFVGALLFRLDARNPATLALAFAVLMAVGLFAGWLPARRAARVEPIAALRN